MLQTSAQRDAEMSGFRYFNKGIIAGKTNSGCKNLYQNTTQTDSDGATVVYSAQVSTNCHQPRKTAIWHPPHSVLR